MTWHNKIPPNQKAITVDRDRFLIAAKKSQSSHKFLVSLVACGDQKDFFCCICACGLACSKATSANTTGEKLAEAEPLYDSNF
jgi:hypothetical protein